ncbi:hypothetical protein F5888DRAFT_1634445 [Russula emetica]|nr:hypothetical protein F5888DRAFT_1634445 [Russula emetica]
MRSWVEETGDEVARERHHPAMWGIGLSRKRQEGRGESRTGWQRWMLDTLMTGRGLARSLTLSLVSCSIAHIVLHNSGANHYFAAHHCMTNPIMRYRTLERQLVLRPLTVVFQQQRSSLSHIWRTMSDMLQGDGSLACSSDQLDTTPGVET